MMQLFSQPRIPTDSASLVLVSGEYPFLAENLKKQGIDAIKTIADQRLPYPVRFHPDMQVCVLNKEILFVLKENELKKQLRQYGIEVYETHKVPVDSYPGDVLCNAFVLGNHLIGNTAFIDSAIVEATEKLALKKLFVKQGYAACSTAIVAEDAVITADKGIASAMASNGFDVLRIRQGYIKLPGYDTGFLGGCCGLIAPKLLAVSGRLSSHPDGNSIYDFLKAKNIDVLELSDNELLDVGGIIPLL